MRGKWPRMEGPGNPVDATGSADKTASAPSRSESRTKTIDNNAADAPGHYTKGLTNYNSHNYSAAILEFNTAVSLDPNLYEKSVPKLAASYFMRGTGYFQKNEYPKAVTDYNEALKLDPGFTNAQKALVLVREKLDEAKLEPDQDSSGTQTVNAASAGYTRTQGGQPPASAAGTYPNPNDAATDKTRRNAAALKAFASAGNALPALIITGLLVMIATGVFFFIRGFKGRAGLTNNQAISPVQQPASAKARDEVPGGILADPKAARFELRVRELMDAGDYNKALTAYASRNLSQITDAEKIDLFKIHLRLGNYDRARLVFEDIHKSELLTRNLELYRNLADLCYAKEQIDLAHRLSRGIFEAMKPAIDIRNNAEPYYDLGRFCEEKGDSALGVDIYRMFMEAGRDKYKDVAVRYNNLKDKTVHSIFAVRNLAQDRSAALKTGVALTGHMLDGRYELKGDLGEGAMGVVYEAWDRKKGRRVAVKRMHSWLKKYPEEYNRFRREAQIVGQLKHPNIVGIHGVIEQSDEIYLIFDYVAGKTLADTIRERKQIPLQECKNIFNGVCDAVHYAHKNNVIHRDLKPANIMMDGTRAMVMDFGLASELRDGLTRVTHQTMSGTPAYMAPEQNTGTVKRESDIFAMGVCLYEMVTGVLPFEGLDNLAQKRSKNYREATALAPLFPVGVDEIISRALEPEPSQRYADALDFFSALNDL